MNTRSSTKKRGIDIAFDDAAQVLMMQHRIVYLKIKSSIVSSSIGKLVIHISK
jgi:hypothetical protein